MSDVDFDQRLGALDSIDAPDLWGRATSMTPRGATQVLRRSSIERVLMVVFPLLVAVAGIAFVVEAFRRAPDVVDQPLPLGPGSIAYAEFLGAPLNQWSLFTMRTDGSAATRIPVDLPGEAIHPSWSPDGSRLAFDVQVGGDTEIYVVDADGSNLSKLTSTDGWNFLPAWSPDGSRIAYVHASRSNHDIWLMNADGSNPVRLTREPDFDLNPTWSPDADKLAFESNRSGNPEIYVMNVDGSNVSRLTDATGFDGSPDWSPDGRIAFVSDRDGPGIYLMESDGTGVRKLVEGKQVGPIEPEWSPDGARLAYASSPGADMAVAIYVVDLGSGQTHALTEPGDICCPSWVLPQEPDTGPAVPGTCDYGPWIKHCPEAEWARSVATVAGVDVIDEESVLVIGPREGGEFLFWAMDPAIHSQVTPLSKALAGGTLVPFGDVDGVPVYVTEDGDKVVWSSHGLNVWVGEHIVGLLPPRRLVVELVQAAGSIPYTSGLPPSAYRQCRPPEVRPTYLPWIEQGDPIPRPIVSYDAEIDRAQLSWPNPNHPRGRAGIGLTVYTHTPLGSLGAETDVVIDGVAGHLHREDEGGLVGMSWTLNGSECNYIELVLADPGSSKRGAIDDLLRIARSLG